MRRTLLAALLVGLVVVASTAGSARPDAQAARDPKEIQSLLEQLQKIPVGSGIRVQLVDGQKLEAQLLEVRRRIFESFPERAPCPSASLRLTRSSVFSD